MPVGLITRDGAGNVLLDTTTSMFRMLGQLHIRRGWTESNDGEWHDMTGSVTNSGLALGSLFISYRQTTFRDNDSSLLQYLSFSVSGSVLTWTWSIAIIVTEPRYIDLFYGVRS